MLRVCLDFGHGGKDSGAIGINGIKEKDINLSVGMKVKQYLEKYNVELILTRDNDSFISLDERVKISNNNNCKLFVSIHCNAHTNPSANGFESYSYKGNSALQKLVHKNVIDHISLSDRGTKKGSYYVINYTKAEAILIELGFITNNDDFTIITNNIDKIASMIGKSIVQYLNLSQKEDNDTYYRVVAGSYKVKDNADKMVEQLKRFGYGAFITK